MRRLCPLFAVSVNIRTRFILGDGITSYPRGDHVFLSMEWCTVVRSRIMYCGQDACDRKGEQYFFLRFLT